MKKKIKLPANHVRALFKPESYDEKRNTIDIVWSTGARVKRYSFFDGPFYEELSMEKKAVRLERLRSGAPVLNNHGTGFWGGVRDLNDVIGVVESAKIEGGEGIATIRFSGRSDVRELIEDIKSGVIRNISVGYIVHKFEETESEDDDEIPVFRAVDWEPMEVSFVAMPADHKAQVRSAESAMDHEAVLQTKEGGSEMKKKQKRSSEETSVEDPSVQASPEAESSDGGDMKEGDKPEGEKPEGEKPEGEASEGDKPEEEKPEGEKSEGEASEGDKPEEEKPEGEASEEGERSASEADIRKREIERQSEIRKAVRVAKLGEEFADELVRGEHSVEEARALIFKELEKRTGNVTKNQRVEVRDMEQKTLRRDAAVRAMLHRFDPEKYKLQNGDGEFRQGSVIDMARHFLALEGVRDAHTMSRFEVARRALHSASDFAEVLANTANKSLRDAYMGAPNTYEPFTRKKNVSDFKEISSVQLGNGGTLMEVNEHGEYKRTTVEESAEKYRVKKFGLILGRTLELIVNDDLDAFTRIPAQLGVRAREKENELFWSEIIANSNLADGVAYFAAGHGNVGTGAISVSSIGSGRAAMRVQTDLEGEIMSVAPRYLIVPAALETTAEQFTASINPQQSGNVNPFAGKLIPVVEPRLDANSALQWYLGADKAQLAAAEMALLDGKGPEIFTREGFEVDGMELKLRYIFGMKLIEHRAMYRSSGA